MNTSLQPIFASQNATAVCSIALMQDIGKRIAEAREAKGMSQSDLARSLGLSPQAVQKWESGGTPRGTRLNEIAKALGESVEYLMFGTRTVVSSFKPVEREATDDEFSAVKRVRFKLSAGVSGFSIDVDDGETPPIFFRKDWFTRNGYRPESLFAVRVSGDSMVPSLYDGDLVVVNTADTKPRDGEVFAVNYEGELVIKRVRLDAGECWLDSDAADQLRFRPRRCGDGCFILGRVVYKQSERI